VSERIGSKAVVEGIDFVRIGDAQWAPTGDGALWMCLQCNDGRVVAAPRAHARWHAPTGGRVRPPRSDGGRAWPTLRGDREAIER
jgi:hypothetical protein